MLDEAVKALIRWQEKVNQLPLIHGMPIARLDTPIWATYKIAVERMLAAAKIAEQQKYGDPRHLRIALWLEECAEKIEACIDGHAIKTLDGICDSIYVDIGAAVRFNMDVSGAFAEIVRSNDSKQFSNDPRVRDKGPNYSPPNLEPFI